MLSYLRIISRYVVGLVFIFSGFVKSVDPIGFSYKLDEYFVAYNMEFFSGISIFLAVLACLLEFVTGVALIMGVWKKLFSWFAFLFMLFFTVLTFLSALYNPVSDCGCFGDAIHLSNWATFYKNVVLMVFVIILIFTNKISKPYFTKKKEFLIISFASLVLIGISVYSYRYLPIMDFLPWKVGNKISEQLIAKQEVAKIFLTYKNTKTGEIKEYPSDNYPWNDSVWVANWEFQKQRKEIVQPYQEAPIHDFNIMDEYSNDLTQDVILNPNYQVIVVAYDLTKASKAAFTDKINILTKELQTDSVSVIGLTSSTVEDINKFKKEVNTTLPLYFTDATALKSMIRANPGILLLKDGFIIDKWHYNCLPKYEYFVEKYLNNVNKK